MRVNSKTQFSILNSQFSILNSQFSILNSQFSILNSQFSIPNSQFPISKFPVPSSIPGTLWRKSVHTLCVIPEKAGIQGIETDPGFRVFAGDLVLFRLERGPLPRGEPRNRGGHGDSGGGARRPTAAARQHHPRDADDRGSAPGGFAAHLRSGDANRLASSGR